MIGRLLVWAASLLAGWVATAVAVTLVRSIGLIVPDGLAWLAALVAGVLVATATAAWTTTLLRRDGTRARLDAVAVVVGVAAVLLLIPVSAEVTATRPDPGAPPPIVLAVQSALVLAAAATAASQLLRRAGAGGHDGRATALLLVGALLVGPVVVTYAALSGQTGS